jgi:hypothetical protein
MKKLAALLVLFAVAAYLVTSNASEPDIGPRVKNPKKNNKEKNKETSTTTAPAPVLEPGKPTPFSSIMRKHFNQWAENGELTTEKLHKLMVRADIKGEAAAAVASLRAIERYGYTRNQKDMPSLTLDFFKRYEAADERVRIEKFGARGDHIDTYFHEFCRRLQATPRILFPQKDPDLEFVYQGYLGDCFFMSMLGAMVKLHPKKIKKMIEEVDDGKEYKVHFAGKPKGPVVFKAPTDAEIALCSTAEANGLWLSVIEKGYAVYVNRHTPKDKREISPTDILGEGGYASDAIAVLTGHGYRWVKCEEKGFAEELENAVDAKCLICTSLRDKIDVPLLHHPHVYAVIGFHAEDKRVTLYDSIALPHFEPKGPAGPKNGFKMEYGVFSMTLKQFRTVFNGIGLEDVNTSVIEKKKK